MQKMNWKLGLNSLALAMTLLISCQKTEEKSAPPSRALAEEVANGIFPYRRLSTYGFFEGEMKNLEPADSVVFYQPASSLFTDYALKSRFISIPAGQKVSDLNEIYYSDCLQSLIVILYLYLMIFTGVKKWKKHGSS